MFEAYFKQLIVNGDGKFSVVRVAAETEEALGVKRDIYLADDFQDATKEEYEAQFAARTAPIDSAADKSLGGEGEGAAEPKEGDVCTLEDGSEGVLVAGENGLVCTKKPAADDES